MTLSRTDSENKDFVELVSHLNNYLKTIDGDEHEFYMQYNGIAALNHTVVAYKNNVAVGCGAFKAFNNSSVEIKRMYTSQGYRGQNIATQILTELETWAKELGYQSCILETGKRQVEAVNFYKKNQYKLIENFGQYKDVDNSICFEKEL
ncbi:GNAT family N-acetyltransferase [Flavobacteriaceae bacterium MHTCC 0001]